MSDPWVTKWLRVEITSPEVSRACEAVKRWCVGCARRNDTPRLLVITGNTGTGKTHLARCAQSYLDAVSVYAWEHGYWSRPMSTAWYPWPSTVEQLNDSSARSRWEQEMSSTTAVLMDDIGAEVDRYKTGHVTAILRNALDLRARRFTLVTTNIAPDAWTSTWDARVADRLLRDSVIVSLANTQSYSIVKRTKPTTPTDI